MRPAYITATRSASFGDDAEIVRDEQQRQVERRLHVAQQIEDLRLDRDVERGRRLVGDDQRRLAGQRHGDQHALAHAAGELVRVVVGRARSGFGMRTARSSSIARCARASRRVARPWTSSVSAIWSPTRRPG